MPFGLAMTKANDWGTIDWKGVCLNPKTARYQFGKGSSPAIRLEVALANGIQKIKTWNTQKITLNPPTWIHFLDESLQDVNQTSNILSYRHHIL